MTIRKMQAEETTAFNKKWETELSEMQEEEQ